MYDSNGWNWNNQQQQNGMQSAPMRPLYTMNAPRQEVIRVNGEAGAKNYRMGPNSSALLLDNTAPIIWYAQTDGTGYLTVAPFDVTPHQSPKPVDMNDLSARVTKLEELIANVQQSNTGVSKQSKKQRQQAVAVANDAATTTTTTSNANEPASYPTI